MKKNLLIIVALFSGFIFADQMTVDSLVQAEKNFAQTSIVRGVRDAFLAFLSEDSILFRPNPVPGKEWVENHPPRNGILSWEPAQAEVSGNLGYTTGPWEFRERTVQEKPVAYGYFVTLWKIQSDGKWKVVLDTGTTNPPSTGSVTLQTSSAEPKSGKIDVEALKKDLLAADKAISEKTYADHAVENARLYRNDIAPVIGKQSITPAITGTPVFEPTQAEISNTGELAYTYGTYLSGSQHGNYVRIWKRQSDGSWKFVIDIATPVE